MHHLLYSNIYGGTKTENYIDWYVLCYLLSHTSVLVSVLVGIAGTIAIQTAVHTEIVRIIADIRQTGVPSSHKPKQLTLRGWEAFIKSFLQKNYCGVRIQSYMPLQNGLSAPRTRRKTGRYTSENKPISAGDCTGWPDRASVSISKSHSFIILIHVAILNLVLNLAPVI